MSGPLPVAAATGILLNRLVRWEGSPGFVAVEGLARTLADELRAAGLLREPVEGEGEYATGGIVHGPGPVLGEHGCVLGGPS